jgi:prophage regulatory protein
MMKPKANRPVSQPVLPAEGYVREAQLLGCKRRGWVAVLPVSRYTLRVWISSGLWPAPRKIGPKVIAWPVEEVRRALERLSDVP